MLRLIAGLVFALAAVPAAASDAGFEINLGGGSPTYYDPYSGQYYRDRSSGLNFGVNFGDRDRDYYRRGYNSSYNRGYRRDHDHYYDRRGNIRSDYSRGSRYHNDDTNWRHDYRLDY